jgi:hypothetical protein
MLFLISHHMLFSESVHPYRKNRLLEIRVGITICIFHGYVFQAGISALSGLLSDGLTDRRDVSSRRDSQGAMGNFMNIGLGVCELFMDQSRSIM